MTNIYDQLDKAFGSVSAFAVFKGAEPVGRVCFKYPKDGAGRLWCYVQVWGAPMVRGYAGGCGYDKASAAYIAAVQSGLDPNRADGESDACFLAKATFCVVEDNGRKWSDQLKDLGYTVQHVIEG